MDKKNSGKVGVLVLQFTARGNEVEARWVFRVGALSGDVEILASFTEQLGALLFSNVVVRQVVYR